MNIVSTDELRLVEAQEISTGTSAEVLMERAGWEAARLINREYSFVRSAHIWVGKGHNGGDGLVIARALASIGWDVQVWLMLPEAEIGELPRRKLAELKEEFPELSVQSGEEHRVWPRTDEILVDALMGIGAKGDLRGSLRQRVEEINQARKLRFFRVVSVDTPSGLHEGSRSLDESTVGESQAVVADLTVTIGYGKDYLFREELAHWVGRILVAPIFQYHPTHNSPVEAIVAWETRPLLPRRSAMVFKNSLGHALIIAGSPGLTGAPQLTSQACLQAGAGLVTLGVRSQIYPIVAASASPQVMVFDLGDEAQLDQALARANVLAIGPGLGLDPAAERLLRNVISRAEVPLLLDADALTLLAQDLKMLNTKASPLHELSPMLGRPPIVLTPHPGEMRRLIGRDFKPADRVAVAREFARTHGVHLILKGVRTVVAQPTGQVWVNTTGNPGLATGGSGDTLLGILTGLVAQGMACEHAARMAVWWHGRAGDLALRHRGCEEGLSIEDVLRCLPQALNEY